MRQVPEWVASNDDQKIPGRVSLRVFDEADGRCQICKVHLIPGRWAIDHRKALCNGGEHRENNLSAVCDICHSVKTRKDVKIKSARNRKRKSLLGIKLKSRFPNSRDGKYKTKIGGRTELRDD